MFRIFIPCVLTSLLLISSLFFEVNSIESTLSTYALLLLITLAIWTVGFGVEMGWTSLPYNLALPFSFVLYFLTFFEFLFDQPGVETMLWPNELKSGISVVLLTFFVLIFGNQYIEQKVTALPRIEFMQIQSLIPLCLSLYVITLVPSMVANNFNLLYVLQEATMERFARNAPRARLGGFADALTTLADFQIIVVIMCGAIFGVWRKLTVSILIKCALIFAFSHFMTSSFFSGTRSVFLLSLFGSLLSFMVTRLLIGERFGRKEIFMIFFAIAIGIVSTQVLLAYRISGDFSFESKLDRGFGGSAFFVDYNIVPLSRIAESSGWFGLLHGEFLFQAITKFIPRFLWEGKPTGLSTSIESVMGVNDGSMTISCTYVGEALLDFGILGVFLYTAIVLFLLRYASATMLMRKDPILTVVFAYVSFALTRSFVFISVMLLTAAIYSYLSAKIGARGRHRQGNNV